MALGRQALQLLRDIKDAVGNGSGSRREPFIDFEEQADKKRARPWYTKRPGTHEELEEEGNHGPLPGIPARFMPFFEAAFLKALQGMAADVEDDGRFVPIEHARNAYYLAEAAVGVLREAEQQHAEMHARMAEDRRQREADEKLREAELEAERARQHETADCTPPKAADVKKALRKVPRAKKSPGQELAAKIASTPVRRRSRASRGK